MDKYLEKKLCSADLRLQRMVESVTKRPCHFKRGDGGYFFAADYAEVNDPQTILALWDAIEGYLGERLQTIADHPEHHALYVEVKYFEEKSSQK